MKNLPVEVDDNVIDEMFAVADTDNDGKLGYKVSRMLRSCRMCKLQLQFG